MYYIYEIYNKVTGRKYIGMTQNHSYRYSQHMSQLKYGTHTEKVMQKDYVLYGEDSFDYRLLEIVEEKKLAHKREVHYMIINKTHSEEYGYNSQDTIFNKYQNNNDPVNSQNIFYQKIKETGMPLCKFAAELGISRKALIHGITHIGSMKASAFCKMVNILPLDIEDVCKYKEWIIDKTKLLPKESQEKIKEFSQLSTETQDLVIRIMEEMLSEKRMQEG